MYPDFLVFRRDRKMEGGYMVDILEPHGPQLADNLAKAKGLAKYAEAESRCGRIQMIRQVRMPSGRLVLSRLSLDERNIRDRVRRAATNEELDSFFVPDSE